MSLAKACSPVTLGAIGALSLAACAQGAETTLEAQGGSGGLTTSSTTTSTTSSTTSSTSSTSASTGSTSTNSGACAPGTKVSCYTGALGTAGIGACHEGLATCLPDGSAFGPCLGEVTPSPEDCQTSIDEDCDGLTPPCPGAAHARWIKSIPLTVGTSSRVKVVGVVAHPIGATLLLLELATDIDLGLGLVHASSSWCDGALLLVALDQAGNPVWQMPVHGGVKNASLDVGTEGSTWLGGINWCPSSTIVPTQGIFLLPVSIAGGTLAPWYADPFQINSMTLAVSGPNAGVLTEGWSFDGAGQQGNVFGVQLATFAPGSPPMLLDTVETTAAYGEHAVGRAGNGFAVYSGQSQTGLHRVEVFTGTLQPAWSRSFNSARVLGTDTIDPVLLVGGEIAGVENLGMGAVTADSIDGFLAGYHAATGNPLFVVQAGGPGDQIVVSVGGGGGSFAAAMTADPTTIAGTPVEGGVVIRLDATGTVAWARSVLAKPGTMRVSVAKDGSVIVAGTYRGGAVSGYPVAAEEGLAIMALEP